MVFGGLGALGGCAWALLLLVSLLFGKTADRAMTEFRTSPLKHLMVGGLAALVTLIVGVAAISSPFPPLKVVGGVILFAQFLIGAVGGSGLVTLMSGRIDELVPVSNRYAALARAAGLLVGSCLLPLIGWFALLPLIHMACLSVGLSAMWGRKPRSVVLAPPPTVAGLL